MEELKNCIGGGFWGVWENLYEFFKFNLCSYNILKIKNILIISINLSLFKKILFQKMWKISQFPQYFSPPKAFPSPPLRTPKQSLRGKLDNVVVYFFWQYYNFPQNYVWDDGKAAPFKLISCWPVNSKTTATQERSTQMKVEDYGLKCIFDYSGKPVYQNISC